MAAIARFNEDTRFARRASRESDELNGILTRGSPLGIGQPRANFLDTFGVVSMPRSAEEYLMIVYLEFSLA